MPPVKEEASLPRSGNFPSVGSRENTATCAADFGRFPPPTRHMLMWEGIVLKKAFWVAAFAAAIGGAALHFLYTLFPSPLTALLAPVNESVWEHLKLLFYPTLLAAFVLARKTDDKYRLWSGFFAALLAMPVCLLGVYFLLRCGFGVDGLTMDIALYFAVMFGGFALAGALARSGRLEQSAAWLLLPVMLYGACLILFTFAAPPLAIFMPSAA